MTRNGALITLGVLVFLSPFYGLPSAWLWWLLPVFGICIVGISISLRKVHSAPETPVRTMEAAAPEVN